MVFKIYEFLTIFLIVFEFDPPFQVGATVTEQVIRAVVAHDIPEHNRTLKATKGPKGLACHWMAGTPRLGRRCGGRRSDYQARLTYELVPGNVYLPVDAPADPDWTRRLEQAGQNQHGDWHRLLQSLLVTAPLTMGEDQVQVAVDDMWRQLNAWLEDVLRSQAQSSGSRAQNAGRLWDGSPRCGRRCVKRTSVSRAQTIKLTRLSLLANFLFGLAKLAI